MIKTKTICDLCGKEVFSTIASIDSEKYTYSIEIHETSLDMCKECREALGEWVKKRKEENGMLKKED